MLFFMNWIRFTNRLFGARIQINEPDRVQFETNEPLNHDGCHLVFSRWPKINGICPLGDVRFYFKFEVDW